MNPDDIAAFEAILTEIERAADAELLIAAVTLSLMVPDICAALEDSKGLTSSSKYAQWYDRHVSKFKEALSGSDAYRVRCGLMHQAKPSRPNMRWQQVGFATSGVGQMLLEGNRLNGELQPDTYVVGVRPFAAHMVECARRWLYENRDSEVVRANLANLMRKKEDALAPMIGGVTMFQ